MTDTIEASGHCLCGAVRVAARKMSTHVGACHCGICRRWGGGPLLAVDCGDDVSFEGAESIGTFQSSEWAERGFCRQCGTHLFYRLKQSNQHMMGVGLFDAGGRLVFDHQVFIDEKPSFYAFANDTKNMTGPELFAQFAPK